MADDTQALKDAEGLVEEFEGFSAAPYPDPVSHGQPWAQGFGSTRDFDGNPVTPSTPPVTRDQARQMAMRDMKSALADVECEATTPLTDEEKGALVDFAYNLGEGALNGSTLLRLINKGDLAAAADQFQLWDHSCGRVVAGLLRRRLAERDLFLKGIQSPQSQA